jgi:DNA-binding NarL/FixJ family response regulator
MYQSPNPTNCPELTSASSDEPHQETQGQATENLLNAQHRLHQEHTNKYAQILFDKKQWLYVQKQYSLTPREKEIAELVCQGFRNERIASHLSITCGTVKTHIRNIYRKIHVKNKIGMLLRFVSASRELSNQYEESVFSPIVD